MCVVLGRPLCLRASIVLPVVFLTMKSSFSVEWMNTHELTGTGVTAMDAFAVRCTKNRDH